MSEGQEGIDGLLSKVALLTCLARGLGTLTELGDRRVRALSLLFVVSPCALSMWGPQSPRTSYVMADGSQSQCSERNQKKLHGVF